MALGAFLAGALVAESGAAKIIEHLVQPVRDMFAAIFFVSVGMLIDPVLVWQNVVAVLVLTVVVIVGKMVGVSVGSVPGRHGVRTSVQAGMSLAQIGEFSFIIAGVGLALGATGDFLYPVAVAVSAITTLLTPWLIRASGRAASYVDRRLPHSLQTYAALYGAWVQGLRSDARAPDGVDQDPAAGGAAGGRLVVVAAIIIAVAMSTPRALAIAVELGLFNRRRAGARAAGRGDRGAADPVRAGRHPHRARAGRRAGSGSAARPGAEGGIDLAAAPRRALLVTLQIAILLVAGIPVVAMTQPFIPRVPAMSILLLGLLLLIVPLWRSATNLHGHVRAGAQVLLEALASQSGTPASVRQPTPAHGLPAMLPGMGNATTIKLADGSAAIGRTLKQIDLRGLTGPRSSPSTANPPTSSIPPATRCWRAATRSSSPARRWRCRLPGPADGAGRGRG